MAELFILLFLLAFIVFWICGIVHAATKEEGTPEEREKNPQLNTKDWDLHQRRLAGFSCSKYRNRMYYIGPRGGYYYYSANGNKVYC